MGCMDSPTDNQEELKSLFERIRLGQPVIYQGNELDPEQRFYVLGLAPNAARLSVRFFYENSFGNILKNIFAHYKRMELIRPKWEQKEYLSVREMLFETVNKKSTDKKPVSNMAAMDFSGNFIRQQVSGTLVFRYLDPHPCRAGRGQT